MQVQIPAGQAGDVLLLQRRKAEGEGAGPVVQGWARGEARQATVGRFGQTGLKVRAAPQQVRGPRGHPRGRRGGGGGGAGPETARKEPPLRARG